MNALKQTYVGALGKPQALILGLVLSTAWSSAASAATFVAVASEDESDAAPGDGACASATGKCTLRAAIEETNATAQYDKIYLSNSRYPLHRGPLVITGQVDLIGREARRAVIDGLGSVRVLEVRAPATGSANVRLVALTLANGQADTLDPRGGALLSAAASNTVSLERCVVLNNFAGAAGGAIYNAGSLDVSRSSIDENGSNESEFGGRWSAAGGGIYNTGSLRIDRSWIGNNAAVRGAGLTNYTGTVSISNSTFGGNEARERGGAIENLSSTFGTTATAEIAFSTLVDNAAGSAAMPGRGGGIYNAGVLRLANSIIARNSDGRSASAPDYAPDCISEVPTDVTPETVSLTSAGGLILGVSTDLCAHAAGPSDLTGSAMAPLDPGLSDTRGRVQGEEADGYTPMSDSVAVDAAYVEYPCRAEDQWGAARPAPGHVGATARCDIGAVELNGARTLRKAMLIVGNRIFNRSDFVLSAHLAQLGFEVADESPSDLTREVYEASVIVLSETVNSAELPSWFFTVDRPMLVLEPGALDELGMTELGWNSSQGVELGATHLNVRPYSPIDKGISGLTPVTESGAKFGWGVPATPDAFLVAELVSAPGHWAIFGYPAGAELADGSRAPAARIAFFASDGTPERLSGQGVVLLYAALDYLVSH